MVSLSYNVDDKKWQESFPLFKKYISKSVIETIKTVKVNLSENSEISFLLTSDKKIQKLNSKYRNKNLSTNVLSFPMMKKINGVMLIGDIAISNEKILKESKNFKTNKYSYLSKITVHGVLHLLGFDHQTDKEFQIMNRYEKNILKKLQ
tara:strand:- start:444 stop:890 length:447 start_codon:yes stop_codon:yes gene_type:complete